MSSAVLSRDESSPATAKHVAASLAAHAPTRARIAFLADYQGQIDFRVLDGPLAGQCISVRLNRFDWDVAHYGARWTDAYRTERQATEGAIFCQAGVAPTADVISAVRARLEALRDHLIATGADTARLAAVPRPMVWTRERGFVALAERFAQ